MSFIGFIEFSIRKDREAIVARPAKSLLLLRLGDACLLACGYIAS